jgi:hypothetical protein
MAIKRAVGRPRTLERTIKAASEDRRADPGEYMRRLRAVPQRRARQSEKHKGQY